MLWVLLRARLQRAFGFANPFQPTLASLQFRRQFIVLDIGPILCILGGLGLREQLCHLVPGRCVLRESAIVRKSGALPAANTRNATSSINRR